MMESQFLQDCQYMKQDRPAKPQPAAGGKQLKIPPVGDADECQPFDPCQLHPAQ